jgi:tRNA A37 N6-isopentenylltransferase MiaA
MKKKSIILILAGILAVSGISLVYGASINNAGLNNLKGQIMSVQSNDAKSSSNYRATMMGTQDSGVQSNDNFNKMIEIMKENGFTDEANAMENRDFDTMKKLIANISDEDYKKMIDVMQNNGYESMANMMQSVGRDNMTKIHQSMMGR